MRRSRTTLYLLFTDWLIIVGSFSIAFYLRYHETGINMVSRHHLIPEMSAIFIYAFIMLGLFSISGLYKRKTLLSPMPHLLGIIKASLLTILIYITIKSLSKSDLFIPSRQALLHWGSILFFSLIFHRLVFVKLLHQLLSKTEMRRRVVVIGDTPLSKSFIEECSLNKTCTMNLVGIMTEDSDQSKIAKAVPCLGNLSILPDIVNTYKLEGAVICNPNMSHQKLMNLIETCVRLFGWVDVHSEKSSALQKSESADAFFDIPFIRMHGIPDNLVLKSWKRVFDFTASLIGIIAISPVLIGTAIAIKLTSPGPIFYTKDRIGKNGKPFPFYKFRSMAIGADQDESRNEQIKDFIQNQQEGETLSKVVNTAYVTPVGKFIRKWAIDELPQLFNVLKGDMALVGPRPVPPNEYEMEDDWHQRRFRINPGCTGLWKLYATRDGVTFNDTVLYDIYYSRNMNPALDLMIIFGTVWVILTGKADG